MRNIQDPRFRIVHDSFSAIPDICEKLGLTGTGFLLDLMCHLRNLIMRKAIQFHERWSLICVWIRHKDYRQRNG